MHTARDSSLVSAPSILLHRTGVRTLTFLSFTNLFMNADHQHYKSVIEDRPPITRHMAEYAVHLGLSAALYAESTDPAILSISVYILAF